MDGAQSIEALEAQNDLSVHAQIDFRRVAVVRLRLWGEGRGATVIVWGSGGRYAAMTFTDPEMARRVAEAFGAAVETEGGA